MALPVAVAFAQEVEAFSLRIRTEIAIPGAQPALPDHAAPSLFVTVGKAAPPPGAQAAAGFQYAPGSLFLPVPGVAHYLYRHPQRTLVVEPLPGSLASDVSALLIASALPAVLWMRGCIMLHASAAVLPGMRKAIAFAGPSGCGKSTLLRHLLTLGARVVSDDAISLDPETLQIAGLPGVTMLREFPAAGAFGSSENIAPLPVSPHGQLASATLGALVMLADTPQPTLRLHGPAALEAVLRNFHRPRVPRLLQTMPVVLPQVAAMLPQLPVYSTHRLQWFAPSLIGLQKVADEIFRTL